MPASRRDGFAPRDWRSRPETSEVPMEKVGFAERYVIARESNVVRVDFRRTPDPPAPQFPGAGALRNPREGNGLQQAGEAA